MLFNSLHFILFFPLVFLFYRLFPRDKRWILLLVASYYFYMAWEVSYVLLILFSTVVDYFAALNMDKADTRSKKKKWLWTSLISNLGLLFVFKYFNFFSDTLNGLFQVSSLAIQFPYHQLLLPVGISFYTFQTLSYTIDVYRGEKEAESHFGIFALYVSFFPQLVAGPIERSNRLLPQFLKHKNLNSRDISDGLKQAVWGFFKKLVIADRVALLVDQVYANPESYSGFPLILATFLFAVQIYCDFSGYSDIAIGTARMMGFELMENFRKPYFAKSFSEFWNRWHISLSTWFRDYVYISLRGNRVSHKRWVTNIIATFIISGLWHGANWTFVVWGTLNGVYFLAEHTVKKKYRGIWRWLQYKRKGRLIAMLITFNLICLAWIFFRADNITEAWYILTNLGTNPGYILSLPRDLILERSFIYKLGLDAFELWLATVSILILGIVDWNSRNQTIISWINQKNMLFRTFFVYCVVMFTLMFGQFGQNEFIYFQF